MVCSFSSERSNVHVPGGVGNGIVADASLPLLHTVLNNVGEVLALEMVISSWSGSKETLPVAIYSDVKNFQIALGIRIK